MGEGDWFSISDVVASYVNWLEVKAPAHSKTFRQRVEHEREAAEAEAIVFAVLHAKHKNPRPSEIIGIGGVDFHCRPLNEPEFVVEVTALKIDTVTRKSGLAGPLESNRVSSFAMITGALLTEAIGKAAQMAKYKMPRILFIVSSHPDASLLLGSHGARELLTGTTSFTVPLSGSSADARVSTRLRDSVFMKQNRAGDGVEPARQSISAVMLVNVTANGANLIGVLHPEPAYAFEPRTFETVHFLKVVNWPIEGDQLKVEWVGPEPGPTFMPHYPVRITDNELRRID